MKKVSIDNWLNQQAAQGALPQLLCIFTDEPLFISQASDLYRTRLRQSMACQRHVIEMDRSFDANSFISLFSEASLFGDLSLIDLRLNQPKLNKDAAEVLAKACQWIGARQTDNFLLVTAPKLNKTQERSAGFSELLAQGTEVVCKPITSETMPSWIAANASRLGVHLHRDAVAWLAERTEGNLLSAYQTLEKLAVEYQGDVPTEVVQSVASDAARFNVFELGPALLSADRKRIIRMINGLQAEGEAPTLVLWALQEEIRAIRETRLAIHNGAPLAEACRQARIWGPRQQFIGTALKRHTAQTLRELTNWCYLAEKTIKGLSKGNPWTLLEIIGLGISGLQTPAPLGQAS